MAFKASKLKQITQQNKDLAFGYLREKESENRSNYPQLIKYLALIYSNAQDQFDPNATHKSLEVHGNCVMSKTRGNAFNAYLKNIVSDGIHIWKFKCHGDRLDDYACIGIVMARYDQGNVEANVTQSIDNFKGDGTCTGYQISMDGNKTNPENTDIWSYDPEFEPRIQDGDIVEMRLDLNKLMLTFKVNDKIKVEIADIENISYRAAISVFKNDTGFTLLSYQDIYV